MLPVGRRRTKNPHCPAGVQEKDGVWYWTPTTERERAARAKLREEARKRGERFTIGCTLGPAGSLEARKKWAEVSGYTAPPDSAGKLCELIDLWLKDGIQKQPNGEPRAESTIVMYKRSIPVLRARFGQCRYGKTAQEAARGEAIGTADIQSFVAESDTPSLANRHFAVLDNIFTFGIRRGKTTYNPCADVAKNAGGVREREPLPWEVEALRTLASPRLGLQMDYEAVTGWRISDILLLKRLQLIADGIRVRYKKRGKRWLWEWSPELRRITAEALELPGASPFPASPVFPTRTGGTLTYSVFNKAWQALKRETNAALAAGILDPDTLEIWPGLVIEDLHFHDLRSKAHDDAEDQDREGHRLLGNTKAVSDRHYRRREQRVKPLK